MIKNVETFLSRLEEIEYKSGRFYFFRGHSDYEWGLIPAIYRETGWIQNEDNMFKEIVLHCPDEFKDCKTTFEYLVKMQHYNMPTRMLDITQNPLIALYFACLNSKSDETDGEVIIFEVPKGEVKYFDSDTVSVISNLSRRPSDLRIRLYYKLPVKDFNEEEDIQLLLHEIRQEKPYFKSEIIASHLNSIKFVKPKLDNPRIIKQDGLFILFGMNMAKTNCAEFPEKYIYQDSERFIIDSNSKKSILDQLAKFGISNRKLFPEMPSVANDIREQYKRERKRIKFVFGSTKKK